MVEDLCQRGACSLRPVVLALAVWAALGAPRVATAQEGPDAWIAARSGGSGAPGALDAAGPIDAGTSDTFDASAMDAGTVDAGRFDAGTIDGGTIDAGATDTIDAGPSSLASEPAHPPATSAPAEATGDVVRTLLGLVALLALAWLGGHRRVRQLEERLGVAQVMTSGFPFVLLGLLAHAPGIDILSVDTVARLTPILQFGLGWIGFHTGFQLDSRATAAVPRGTGTVVILVTALPFFFITALAGATLWGMGLSTDHISLTRDAVMLGLAGALSAPPLAHLARTTSARALQLVHTMSMLDDVVVIIAFACMAAWLRPVGDDTGWVLPAVGWVFVTFGMAAVLGLLTDAVIRGTDSRAERASLLLGLVAFTSGMAAVFQLPPLVVCFLAGVLFRNLPAGTDKREMEEAFARLERPIYHLFLIFVGALWRPEELAGWLVLPLFLVARTVGRYAGARVARSLPIENRPECLDEAPDGDLALPPMGQLAIAFVITAQTLYESAAVRALVTAVIGGSIAMELVVQLGARRRVSVTPPAPASPSASHDDRGAT
ncbi:MAG: cation:proton antiporter [Sandaracinaceae bacterium]|nr:cation:proton antiporter [Sandaracinaceae bacterium]